MRKLLGFPSVQIVLCVLVYVAVGLQFGALAWVIGAVALGVATSRSFINLAANFHQTSREHMWLPMHGVFYDYKGVRIEVLEDDDHCRWVKADDVRRTGAMKAPDRGLAATYPDAWQVVGKPPAGFLRDDALHAHLIKENRPESLRMAIWVDRNLVIPSKKVRSNLGIHVEPLKTVEVVKAVEPPAP